MTWSYEPANFLTFGGNSAEAAKSVLSDGPIGLHWRTDVARVFRACGEKVDLTGIKTSCAVDASACWYWAGRRFSISRAHMEPRGHIGGPIAGSNGWLEAGSGVWIPNDGSQCPDVGDILGFGPSMGKIHHVEIVIEAKDDHTVLTAHGGDSPNKGELVQAGIWCNRAETKRANGTVMRMGAGFKELTGVCGWFSAKAVAAKEGL